MTGNGYPLAAVVCRREIAESFASSGIEYFNTFSGNSVACAIGEAVLDTLAEEDLQTNALVVGDYLQTRVLALCENYPCIGEVRGVGLFQGIEFIHPPSHSADTPRPHPDLARFLVDALMERRIIVSQDGPDENVIKLKPPLVFSKENADTLVGELEIALQRARDMRLF
jgi:4-aminobutyrate aminotransferase-like enzyme